jgi:hypothetical protein
MMQGMGSWKDLFILVFAVIQLVVPLRGFTSDKHESRGNFSWNMYSKSFSCRIRYVRYDVDGRAAPYDHKRHFATDKGPMKVYHRDELPRFHAWLCEELSRDPKFARLEGAVNCRLNRGERTDLVPKGTDICASENFGVE